MQIHTTAIYYMVEYRTSVFNGPWGIDEDKNKLDYNLQMIDENSSKGTIALVDKTLICDIFILIPIDLITRKLYPLYIYCISVRILYLDICMYMLLFRFSVSRKAFINFIGLSDTALLLTFGYYIIFNLFTECNI